MKQTWVKIAKKGMTVLLAAAMVGTSAGMSGIGMSSVAYAGEEVTQNDFTVSAGENVKVSTDLGNPTALTYGDAGFTLRATGTVEGAAVTYESSNPEVLSVGENGAITVVGAGGTAEAPVTITATSTAEGYQKKEVKLYFTVAKKTVIASNFTQIVKAGDTANIDLSQLLANAGIVKGDTITYSVEYVFDSESGRILAEENDSVDELNDQLNSGNNLNLKIAEGAESEKTAEIYISFENSNYSFENSRYQSTSYATLTVLTTEKLPLVSTATFTDKTYDQAAYVTPTVTWKNGEDVVEGLETTITYYKDYKKLETVPTNAGTYVATVEFTSDAYVASGILEYTFTIKKKEATVKVDDMEIMVGDALPTFE